MAASVAAPNLPPAYVPLPLSLRDQSRASFRIAHLRWFPLSFRDCTQTDHRKRLQAWHVSVF